MITVMLKTMVIFFNQKLTNDNFRQANLTYLITSTAAGLTGAMGIPGAPALPMSGTNASQQEQYLDFESFRVAACQG